MNDCDPIELGPLPVVEVKYNGGYIVVADLKDPKAGRPLSEVTKDR